MSHQSSLIMHKWQCFLNTEVSTRLRLVYQRLHGVRKRRLTCHLFVGRSFPVCFSPCLKSSYAVLIVPAVYLLFIAIDTAQRAKVLTCTVQSNEGEKLRYLCVQKTMVTHGRQLIRKRSKKILLPRAFLSAFADVQLRKKFKNFLQCERFLKTFDKNLWEQSLMRPQVRLTNVLFL